MGGGQGGLDLRILRVEDASGEVRGQMGLGVPHRFPSPAPVVPPATGPRSTTATERPDRAA